MRHFARPRRRSVRGQVRTLLATLVLVAGLLPTELVAVARAAGPALPSGFTDEVTEYSSRGNVIAVAYVTPAVSILRPGRTTTFTVSFGALAPSSTQIVGRAAR